MNSTSKVDIFLSQMTKQLFTKFHRLPIHGKYATTFLTISALAYLDVLSGYEFGFSFFYLIPVAFASWFISIKIGKWTALLCGVLWGVLDVESGHMYSNGLYPVWNAMMRIGFYLVTVNLLAAVRYAFDQQKLLSQTDFLTGLYNRRSMHDFLDRAIAGFKRSNQKAVIAYFDLDNFKKVNDTQGHDEGDRALKLVADTLEKTLRKTDFVGRMGGDEFMIVFTNTGLEIAQQKLEKLNEVLVKEMQGQNWPITFSIGALELNHHYGTVDDVTQAADKMMYEAKNNGKNSIRLKIA